MASTKKDVIDAINALGTVHRAAILREVMGLGQGYDALINKINALQTAITAAAAVGADLTSLASSSLSPSSSISPSKSPSASLSPSASASPSV